MRKSNVWIGACVLVATMASNAYSQCTCTGEIDALATSVAQMRNELNMTKVRLQLLTQQVKSLSGQTSELRTRLWPAFYRGAPRLDEILSTAETHTWW